MRVTLPLKGILVSRLFTLALALAFPLAAVAQTAGQAFPSKPMRIVVPFTPAGAVDIATRATANEMTKILGHPVAVENKPGAGGNLGVLDVARSAPDGYSMVMSTSGIQAINPALYAKMPLDVNKDLAPVAPIVSLSNVLVVHPSVPAKSVQDVIDLAKKNPGKWTYASSGNGTSIHMSGAMFTQLTGTDIVHIPYKGSAPAITDLLAGQTNMMFDNIPSALPHIKSGKLRALATTGAKRDPALPDLPTDRGSRRQGLRVGRVVRHHGAGGDAARRRHEAERRRGAGHQGARVRQAHARPRLQHHWRIARADGHDAEGGGRSLGADREGFRSKGGLRWVN